MNKRGLVFIVIGAVLIAAALGLVIYNMASDASASKSSYDVLMELTEDMKNNRTTPTYSFDPDADMPTKQVDGWNYIGVLEIPSLNLVLPVIDQWSYDALLVAPARYTGSAYLDNMVLAAHNYTSHFGRLRELSLEDEIRFVDVVGNVFYYKVQELQILPPTAAEEMTLNGDWDLTLFTCTWGGQSRVTVRCTRVLQYN